MTDRCARDIRYRCRCYLCRARYLLIKINSRAYGKRGLSNSLNVTTVFTAWLHGIYRAHSHNWERNRKHIRTAIKEKSCAFARVNCENFHGWVLMHDKLDSMNFANLIGRNTVYKRTVSLSRLFHPKEYTHVRKDRIYACTGAHEIVSYNFTFARTYLYT